MIYKCDASFQREKKKSLFSARPRLSVFLSLDNFFFLVVEKVRVDRQTSIEKKRTDQNKKELLLAAARE